MLLLVSPYSCFYPLMTCQHRLRLESRSLSLSRNLASAETGDTDPDRGAEIRGESPWRRGQGYVLRVHWFFWCSYLIFSWTRDTSLQLHKTILSCSKIQCYIKRTRLAVDRVKPWVTNRINSRSPNTMTPIGNLDLGHLNDTLSYLDTPISKSCMSLFLLSTWSIFWGSVGQGDHSKTFLPL